MAEGLDIQWHEPATKTHGKNFENDGAVSTASGSVKGVSGPARAAEPTQRARFTSWFSATLGYRYLHLDYQKDNFLLDANVQG